MYSERACMARRTGLLAKIDLLGAAGEVCEVRREDDGATPTQQQPHHPFLPHAASHAGVKGGEGRVLAKERAWAFEKEGRRNGTGQIRKERGRGRGSGRSDRWEKEERENREGK